MAANDNLITPGNLKSNMFESAFGATPHKYFAIYDDLMDELIIKITMPDTLVAEFPITEHYSLLVEPKTFEVVGLQLSEFTTEHLPNMNNLNKVWIQRNLPSFFSNYRVIDYKPSDLPIQQSESYFFVRPERIDNILVTA